MTRKILSIILCALLVTALVFTPGCKKNETVGTVQGEVTELGEGEREFDFTVTDGEGNATAYLIRTDKETVGAALLELELIDGDEGEFGLYVKKVNGITADYDKDGTYWAFYLNDEYATSGVDTTEIKEGDSYAFRINEA